MAHLKHLQSILTKLQHNNLEEESFVQIVKKTVIAEVKVNFCSWSSVRNIHQHCF